MSIKERVAYLKGLAEGLGLDSDSKTEKLISVIIDMLADIADEIEDLNDNALDIGEELDALSDDLAEVEEYLFGVESDDDDFDAFDFDDDDDDECGCATCRGAKLTYEVACPSCGAEINLNEADLASESIKCAACGEELEFEFDEDELDELDSLDEDGLDDEDEKA